MPSPRRYGVVGEQRVDGQLTDGLDVDGVGGVVGWHRHGDPLRPAPRLLVELREDPAVGGVADGIHRRPADGAVIRGVPRSGDGAAPVLAVVLGHDDVGALPADRRRDVTAQGEVLDDPPVGVAEELDRRHADDGTAGALLRLARGPGVVRRHRVDARLARRHEDVGHLATGGRPGRDRAGDAVLDVVGVGDDDRRPSPAVGELGEVAHRSALSPPSTTSVCPVM